jgi:hypothetical protein
MYWLHRYGSCFVVSCGRGSGMFIPDQTFFHPGSELSPSRIRIKELKYFNPKKWFLSSRNYDSGCSSRIRRADFLVSTHPGSRGHAPDPGSGSATLVARHCGSTQCKRKLGMKSSEGSSGEPKNVK